MVAQLLIRSEPLLSRHGPRVLREIRKGEPPKFGVELWRLAPSGSRKQSGALALDGQGGRVHGERNPDFATTFVMGTPTPKQACEDEFANSCSFRPHSADRSQLTLLFPRNRGRLCLNLAVFELFFAPAKAQVACAGKCASLADARLWRIRCAMRRSVDFFGNHPIIEG
jgi:hypothetical protein